MQTNAPPSRPSIRLYLFARWILGGIFIYSGMSKLSAPETFAVLIDAYGLVPDFLLMPVAVILPVLEILAGAGLLVDLRGSLSMITGMLVVFMGILAYGIHLGLDVDCGCFGPEDPEARAFHGLRAALCKDIVLLAAVAFLYGWRRHLRIKPIRLKRLAGKPNDAKTEDAYV